MLLLIGTALEYYVTMKFKTTLFRPINKYTL